MAEVNTDWIPTWQKATATKSDGVSAPTKTRRNDPLARGWKREREGGTINRCCALILWRVARGRGSNGSDKPSALSSRSIRRIHSSWRPCRLVKKERARALLCTFLGASYSARRQTMFTVTIWRGTCFYFPYEVPVISTVIYIRVNAARSFVTFAQKWFPLWTLRRLSGNMSFLRIYCTIYINLVK